MLNLNVTGTLGKFGYSNIPDDISDQIILIATMQAYKTAVQNAPVDPNDPPVHLRDELQWYFSKIARLGMVWVKLLYANVAEYGSRHRLPHPYIRPAARAAKNKMKAMIRLSTKDAIAKEKA